SGWMANDPDFWRFLGNTFFMMLSLPINMVGSLLLALILNQKIRFTSFYRLMFFLPSILAGVAIFYLWRFIYHSEYGLINALLEKIGLQGQRWLENPVLAKPSLMFMGLWIGMGGASMILYLAALQTIPRDLYEASRIDGADAWQRFWNITWPALHPITFFIFTMGVITGLQGGFESAFVMTNGGPYGATTTIGFYIYTRAYVFFQMGYASAIAWVLFLLTLIITLVNWKRAVARLVSV
ncbi:MAG TPA: sugar ABC transporter permease, partial [Opitutaceae bacterium]|nr:sugar ABC transporter permease [Opitutaceae bacterium]